MSCITSSAGKRVLIITLAFIANVISKPLPISMHQHSDNYRSLGSRQNSPFPKAPTFVYVASKRGINSFENRIQTQTKTQMPSTGRSTESVNNHKISYVEQSTSKSLAIRDHVARRSSLISNRVKRDLDFGLILGSEFPENSSKGMKNLFKEKDNDRKLYHKVTGTMLRILPKGDVQAATVFDIYCVLNFISVEYVNSKTMVKIFGKTAKRFLAMTSKGVLYTTENATNTETNFLHDFVANTHDAYLSRNYHRYITFRRKQGLTKPAKGKRMSEDDPTPVVSQFLLWKLSESDKNKVKLGRNNTNMQAITTSSPVTTTRKTPRNCERSRRNRRRDRKTNKGRKRKNKKRKGSNPCERKPRKGRSRSTAGRPRHRRKKKKAHTEDGEVK